MNVDKHVLKEGLTAMGLKAECHLMAHASLSAFGKVDGGAGTVIEALREVAGKEGAIIMPSFRDAIRSDHYALQECRNACPQEFCPSRERGYTGAVGEVLREQQDSLRSCHPTHSWVGVGGGAANLLSGHRNSLTPCGHDSPFFRLMERNGFILLLGVGVNSLTNIHAVEDARNVPYLSAIDPERRHATYTTSARRIQYAYPELLHAAMKEAGILASEKIGSANCHLIPARGLGAWLWVISEDDPWCLALRPEANRYDPREDALRKVTRMKEVWRKYPDRQAWKTLLAESQKPRVPVLFEPALTPHAVCPAYGGVKRDYPRCAANDLPPWEKFEDFEASEAGVATCGQCNWQNGTSNIL